MEWQAAQKTRLLERSEHAAEDGRPAPARRALIAAEEVARRERR
jgi:hypothetical protein